MTVGQTHQLGKIVGPSDAKVHWNVANDNIATIDQTGKITALAPGSTAVWIEVTKFEVIETATFTLTISKFDIINKPANNKIYVGQTLDLLTDPSNVNVIWSSSNTNVAKFTNNTLTALRKGETVITANWNGQISSFTLNVTSILIYQSKNTLEHYFKDDDHYSEHPIYAEDLEYGDLSMGELYSLNLFTDSEISSMTAEDHLFRWQTLARLVSMQPLQDVLFDMIDHFMSGNTYIYQNDILDQKIYEHQKTKDYIDDVKLQLEYAMKDYNGDILSLEYNATDREHHPLVDRLSKNKIFEPAYDSPTDIATGYTMCIDSFWGNKFEVISFSKDVTKGYYSGVLKFTFYDHFGLDFTDIQKYHLYGGFVSWYLLQHNDRYNKAYKPFITLVEISVPFSGYYQ